MVHHEENVLLVAVQKLSAPRKVAFVQSNAAGITCTSWTQQPALLELLRGAVAGGIGSHDGGGADGARLPFDPGAMRLYDEIEDAVSVWFVDMFAQPVHLLPEKSLAAWYPAYENQRRAGEVDKKIDREITSLVRGWVSQIDDLFDPVKRVPLTIAVREPVVKPKMRRKTNALGGSITEPALDVDGQPIVVPVLDGDGCPVTRVIRTVPATCPDCGCQWAFDRLTGDKSFALVMMFRDEGEKTEENASALCRACETVWSTTEAMKVLNEAIEAEEAELNSGA